MGVAAGLVLLFLLLTSSSPSSLRGVNASHNPYHQPGPPDQPPGQPPDRPPDRPPTEPPGKPDRQANPTTGPIGPGSIGPGSTATTTGAGSSLAGLLGAGQSGATRGPCARPRDSFEDISRVRRRSDLDPADAKRDHEPTRRVFSYCVVMTGDQVVPGPGDPDGLGVAVITIPPFCYDIAFTGIEDATFGGLHRGDRGEEGKFSLRLFNVDLDENEDPETTPITECRRKAGGKLLVKQRRKLFRKLERNPERFYLELANEEFEDGAIRGQLVRFGGIARSFRQLPALSD